MKIVQPADTSSVRSLIKFLRGEQLSYAEVGSTLEGIRASGYRNDRYVAALGTGDATFERAVRGLQTWKAHRVPGVRVVPEDSEIKTGATVVVTLGIGPVALAAPCRVVRVIDEPHRWGFAYGTLPGHPEQGEEAFIVSIATDGEVTFEITAFSRPGDALTRLAGPIGRRIQMAGTKGYLRALRRWVDDGAAST